MRRLLAILLWSVISAAFIGPGTVTTAGAAGAEYNMQLLWALVFSVIACLALQEAAGRLTAVTGLGLATAIRERFGRPVSWLVVFAVVLGCAAYEAGNILGALAGAALGLSLPPVWLTLGTGGLALLLLWSGGPRRVARLLFLAVAAMGVAFVVCAVLLRPPLDALVRGSLVPSLPPGSAALVLGLIGTTVVPYNLFLGSGLARGQSVAEIRLGLGVAILLGGAISIAILVSATAIHGEFGYCALAAALGDQLGPWAATLFAFGLFAAGLSSAVTAPLAAAMSVRSLVTAAESHRWGDRSWRFRCVWLAVLAFGVGFGLAGVKPIPVIVLAQALNGVLLPLVAVFLLIATNDRALMGTEALNGPLANAGVGLSCLVALVLGISGLMRAVVSAFGIPAPGEGWILLGSGVAAAVLAILVVRRILRLRAAQSIGVV